MLDIVCPGWNNECGNALGPVAFPISIVTAMVSPTALPRPSIDAPIRPDLEYGITASLKTSHFVAPSMYAASLWLFGTASIISLEIADIVGIIMMARTMLAVKISKPNGLPEKIQTLLPNAL